MPSLDEPPERAAAPIHQKIIRVGTDMLDGKPGDEIVAGPALHVADAVGQLRRDRQQARACLALVRLADVVAHFVLLERNRPQRPANLQARRRTAGPENKIRRSRRAVCRDDTLARRLFVGAPGSPVKLLGREVQRHIGQHTGQSQHPAQAHRSPSSPEHRAGGHSREAGAPPRATMAGEAGSSHPRAPTGRRQTSSRKCPARRSRRAPQ